MHYMAFSLILFSWEAQGGTRDLLPPPVYASVRKPSFLGEGNGIKDFSSQVNCLVTSVVPPTPFNPVIKTYFLIIFCKIFLPEKKC